VTRKTRNGDLRDRRLARPPHKQGGAGEVVERREVKVSGTSLREPKTSFVDTFASFVDTFASFVDTNTSFAESLSFLRDRLLLCETQTVLSQGLREKLQARSLTKKGERNK
jgi:hypothetical protein